MTRRGEPRARPGAALEDPLLGGKDGTDLEEGEEGSLVQDKSFWASLLSLAVSVPALVGS